METRQHEQSSALIPVIHKQVKLDKYRAENWTWNGAQKVRVHAVEMSYLRGACGVSRWDGLKMSVYDRCGGIGENKHPEMV